MVLSQLGAKMQKRNISNVELAAKTMMSSRSIENAKKGKGISINTGRRIAAGMKMKLEELV